jgi:DNA mismatch repair protein MSH4
VAGAGASSTLSSPFYFFSPPQAPRLAGALEGASNPLLRVIRGNLASQALDALRARIDEVITEDTTWSRSALSMRHQECFAVRPGIDGNLDAVRTVREGGGG